MLWQGDKQTGMEGCRQSGHSGITKRSALPEWHRRLGIQGSSRAQCLSHISGDWVIHCWTMKRCCWLPFHFFNFCERAARPGSPRGSESLYHEELGPGRRCIIGHWTSCNRLFLLPPAQTITWGNITVLVQVSRLAVAETVICTGKKNLLRLSLNLSMKTQNFLSCTVPTVLLVFA